MRPMRRKKTRSYTMSDRDFDEQIEKQLPYPTEGGELIYNSELILHALRSLPRKKN
jgi:hypothetical protein